MAKNIEEFLEENEKYENENDTIDQRLQDAKGYINSIKTGNIDALVIAGEESLKIYTEKTADKTYRVLIEKMTECAITLNKDGTILYCNFSFANMVNLPLQKVIGTFFVNFIESSSKDHFEDLFIRGKNDLVKEELSICTNDDKLIPVLMSINTFLLDDNFVLGIILTDLTIQNRNQEELKSTTTELLQKNVELNLVNSELVEKAHLLELQDKKVKHINDELNLVNQYLEKRVFERTRELENLNYELKDLNLSKDKFLSVISHDLRNPLTALLLSSEELSLNTENPVFEKVQPFIKTIYSASRNILQQLNDVVDWAQKQREITSLNPEKIHLVFNVDHSLELLKPNALQKNILIENRVRFDVYVKADILMLRSIFQNLVTNAIKYSPHGGLITITSQSVGDMVEISIIDNGIGMSADIRDHLFINSHASSVPGTGNEKGSGLGLLLVKDFVDQQKGSIWAESELGKGTSIVFTLPGY